MPTASRRDVTRRRRRPALTFLAATAIGVGSAALVTTVQGAADNRWHEVVVLKQIQADAETLHGLASRSSGANEILKADVAYAAELTTRSIEDSWQRLVDSDYERRLLNAARPILNNFVRSANETIDRPTERTTQEDQVLDPEFAALRDQLNALVHHLQADALQTSRSGKVTVWVALPLLSALCGLLVMANERHRRRLVTAEADQRQRQRFESMIASVHDVITVVDHDMKIAFASSAAQRSLQLAPEALVGTHVTDLIEPADRPLFESAAAHGRATGEIRQIELRLRTGDGSSRYFEAAGVEGNHGLYGTVWTWRDVHDRKSLEDQLAHAAFHDSLTGLANRALFRDRVEQTLLRSLRTERPTVVLLIDLDGFKSVNDTLGHSAGDAALSETGVRLQGCLRAGDTLARLGGDEYAALLEGATEEEALVVADRMMAAVCARLPLTHDGGQTDVALTASIGIAVSRPGTDRPDELVRNADVAMYAAKAAGKSCARVFVPDMFATARERYELQNDLQQALERGQLELHFQPIVELSNRHVVGLEALLRWRHPTRGDVSPSQFIPIAEESGLILQIGRWVLERAVVEAARHAGSERPLKMNVNVSARQLLDASIVDDVASALTASGLDPALLELEITETVLLNDSEQCIARLQALKALGVRLALDDFGTGYSSLSYLQRLPIDTVKIDRSFVNHSIGDSPRGQALLDSIVQLGHTLRLETVAEGIEDDDQLRYMQRLGCAVGQGFLFAHAVRSEEIESVIQHIERTASPATLPT